MKPLKIFLTSALLLVGTTAAAQVNPVTIINPAEDLSHILGSAQMDMDAAEEIVILVQHEDRIIIVDSGSGITEFDSAPYGWVALKAPAYNRADYTSDFGGHNFGTDVFVDTDGDGIYCAMVLISATTIYEQELAIICLTGNPTSAQNPDVPEQQSGLDQNHPNPFNPTTQIDFYLARSGHSVMKIYDVRGNLVRTLLDDTLPEGKHSLVWDGRDDRGRDTASGTYFYRLETNGQTMTKKSLFVK